MPISHHIGAALASERERDLVAPAHRWRRFKRAPEAGPVQHAEPVRIARFAPAPEPAQPRVEAPCAERPRDGRIAVRIARSQRAESGGSANARGRERVGQGDAR
jgi:hypothetical protein